MFFRGDREKLAGVQEMEEKLNTRRARKEERRPGRGEGNTGGCDRLHCVQVGEKGRCGENKTKSVYLAKGKQQEGVTLRAREFRYHIVTHGERETCCSNVERGSYLVIH